MANLIVKPTSGGSLILQDEGGDAALTVGATGNVTIANDITLSGTATGDFGGGAILQVVQKVMQDTDSTTNTTDGGEIISGAADFAVTITPADNNNKILLQAVILCSNTASKRDFFMFNGGNSGITGTAATGHECFSLANVGANTQATVVMSYLDAPATASAVTYSVYWWVEANTGWINRAGTQDSYSGNGVSTLTAFEVKV